MSLLIHLEYRAARLDWTATDPESDLYVVDPTVQASWGQTTDSWVTNGATRCTQTPEESVYAQLKVVDGLKPSDNGLFLAHTGGERF